MRWYDLEPDVCMAISMIECAPPNAQVQYAEYIIKLVQEKDKELEYIKNITKTNCLTGTADGTTRMKQYRLLLHT